MAHCDQFNSSKEDNCCLLAFQKIVESTAKEKRREEEHPGLVERNRSINVVGPCVLDPANACDSGDSCYPATTS